ncbi:MULTISPECIES: UDP-glucose 4-epimerase GalE [unclassified Achromobacter]|uniref:UDP-glucose 4-epimerase GalE n=1 Tax=unclassified Achromobacter TaxID=2626865 RepID=UPI000B51BD69|nr:MULTISPECIES: UDP-glucose 4-epimerase GalE [unclassified Achromobacter]OWT68981.1 UDP-glucose 4-epimerase GalE [Achromobacter sp. HZ28]OWT78456.1 UDP-glucose 4-epimerase GalE [Achromobacter sp. HZ34]
MSSYLLVTGGAGYIGSHTLVELIAAGYQPVVLDNLSNGSRDAVRRVEKITGTTIPLIQGDIRTPGLVETVMAIHRRDGRPIECVLHLAGVKAVGESVSDPLKYFDNNVSGTVALLMAMRAHDVKRLVFSSSATVYGVPCFLPFTEAHPLAPTNPYGRTKLFVEQMLQDVCAADSAFSAVTLRYFNPIGAHPSGMIGENPRDTPNNLFPYITQVAVGKQPFLKVFGADYPTEDGTGVRDYLHVMDLAVGHVRAVDYASAHPGFVAINLGTGKGTSVMELVQTFERVSGQAIPLRIEPRRAGDVDKVWADASLAQDLLRWRTTLGVENMCQDGWRWQQRNPGGYGVAVAEAGSLARS